MGIREVTMSQSNNGATAGSYTGLVAIVAVAGIAGWWLVSSGEDSESASVSRSQVAQMDTRAGQLVIDDSGFIQLRGAIKDLANATEGFDGVPIISGASRMQVLVHGGTVQFHNVNYPTQTVTVDSVDYFGSENMECMGMFGSVEIYWGLCRAKAEYDVQLKDGTVFQSHRVIPNDLFAIHGSGTNTVLYKLKPIKL